MQEKENLTPSPRKGLFRNWLSLAGAVIATGSVFSCLFLFATELFLPHSNPYMGILVYILAPVFFFLGIALMIVGFWMQRRQKPTALSLAVNLSRPRDRKLLGTFIGGALVFLLCSAIGSYQTYEYTDSIQFCGTACHVPMKPEYTAYLQSPHARVACVECHVGAGAKWYLRSKLNGVHQLFDVALDRIPRPIETPLNNLRPARETCEKCHWPQRFIGDIDRTDYHYLSDETNTPFAVRLELKVGGGRPDGTMSGIHWHVSSNFKVQYIATDRQRQVIPWVRVTDIATGKTTVYRNTGFTNDPAKYTVRTMDCIDCHTRPSHDFLSPDEAVDTAITAGLLDRSVPWLRSNIVATLTAPYQTTDEAMQKIAASLHASYPKLASIDGVVAETEHIYQQNFFPEMKTDWRVHPDNIGHKISAGCFRCHDGNHTTDDGKQVISADCNLCHIILTQGSDKQLQQLNATGDDFYHIDSVYTEPDCASCQTGAL
jgi:nitrate/TMAO reductase-like tetraheme cytochrome c subunit